MTGVARSILVTGASGFIGRAVVPLLAARGDTIHAVSRSAPRPPGDGVRWHQADLLVDDVGALLDDIRPSHLLHLAWYTVNGKFCTAEENRLWVDASLRLLRAFAVNGGRRAVVAGSCAE